MHFYFNEICMVLLYIIITYYYYEMYFNVQLPYNRKCFVFDWKFIACLQYVLVLHLLYLLVTGKICIFFTQFMLCFYSVCGFKHKVNDQKDLYVMFIFTYKPVNFLFHLFHLLDRH